MLANVNDVKVKKGINLEKIISKYATRVLDKTRVKLEKRYNRKNDFQFMECRPYHECAVLSETLLDEFSMEEYGMPYHAFDDPLAVVKKIHDGISEYDQMLSHEDIDNIIVRTMLKSSKKRFYNVLESVFDNLTNNLTVETYMVSFNEITNQFFKDGVSDLNILAKQVYDNVNLDAEDNDNNIIVMLTDIIEDIFYASIPVFTTVVSDDDIMNASHNLINHIATCMKSNTERIIFNIREIVDVTDVEFKGSRYNTTYVIINSDAVLDWSMHAPHKLSELFNEIIKTVSEDFDNMITNYKFGTVTDHMECVKSIYGFENMFDKVNNLDLYNKVLDEFGLSDEDDDDDEDDTDYDDVDEGIDDI